MGIFEREYLLASEKIRKSWESNSIFVEKLIINGEIS